MTEPRYQNGKIYKLVSNITDKIYIGSTCVSLAKRLYEHRNQFKRFKDRKKKDCSSSKELFEIDPNIKIILIEDYPCQSKNELERRERYHIETNVCVNKIIPTRTKEEYQEQHKNEKNAQQKEYYQQNKDKIYAQHKEYRLRNKDKIFALQKEYQEQHKDEISAYHKKWYQQNRKEIIARQKQYQQQNKDKINERRRELQKSKKQKANTNNDSAVATDNESDEPILIFIE